MAEKDNGREIDLNGTPTPESPEITRMKAVKDKSQVIREFMEWRASQPMSHDLEQLLADFFGIDLVKVEAEKRALLTWLRAQRSDPEEVQEMIIPDTDE